MNIGRAYSQARVFLDQLFICPLTIEQNLRHEWGLERNNRHDHGVKSRHLIQSFHWDGLMDIDLALFVLRVAVFSFGPCVKVDGMEAIEVTNNDRNIPKRQHGHHGRHTTIVNYPCDGDCASESEP
jgi:hypothetical protein